MEIGQITALSAAAPETEPTCLTAYLAGSPDESYEYDRVEVNPADEPDTAQVIIGWRVEGCNAEVEVFSQLEGVGLASLPTRSTVQAARLVCKQDKEKVNG
jgi:hypothetical protein